jgi:hypothetical protein
MTSSLATRTAMITGLESASLALGTAPEPTVRSLQYRRAYFERTCNTGKAVGLTALIATLESIAASCFTRANKATPGGKLYPGQYPRAPTRLFLLRCHFQLRHRPIVIPVHVLWYRLILPSNHDESGRLLAKTIYWMHNRILL